MDEYDYRDLALYYGREKMYNCMQSMALIGVGKFLNDFSFRLLNGFSLALGGKCQEGIRELIPIHNETDFSLAVTLALIHAHKCFNQEDREALTALDIRLKKERKNLTPTSSYYASVFLFLSGKYEKANDYVEKVLTKFPDNVEALTLKGWCELSIKQKITVSTLELFARALKVRNNSINAHLGQVKYYQITNDLENAVNTLNKLSIRHPDLVVCLVEKMKTQLSAWNWDHAMETSERILKTDPTNIDALRIKAVIEVCKEGNINSALDTLGRLFTVIEQIENTNGELFYCVSLLISSIAGRNYSILNEAYKFAEKSLQISPNNAIYITHIGYICIKQKKNKDACKFFKAATKLDDNSISALCGLTLCTINESAKTESNWALDQARQQIDFLRELNGENKNALLLYMSAKVFGLNNPEIAVQQLIEACEVHFSNLHTQHFGVDYLIAFDAEFLLDITKELLKYSPIQESFSIGDVFTKDILHVTITTSLNILDSIVKACPGLIEGVFLLARVQYLSADTTTASKTLQKILQEIDPSYVEAHLLMAQINIKNKLYQRALQCLEICLSHNFKVRENPLYHLLNGIIQKEQALYNEAIKSFSTAMNLNNIDSPSSNLNSNDSIGLVDTVTLYLETISTYVALNQPKEANKLMQIVMEKFSNTSEKGRIIISSVEFYLLQGNINEAIDALRQIHPGQPYYLQSRTKMADIYLTRCKDRLGFAHCFKEIVENDPRSESYLMLGDAFMSIQEPDEAINAYKVALKQNSSDPILASKLGRAFVKTHQYTNAISYYRDAIFHSENYTLKIDLAELYLKLKQFREAESILCDEILTNHNTDDLATLQIRSKQLLLLSRVHEKSGNLATSLTTLKTARDNQQRVLQRMNVELGKGRNAKIEQQARILMAKICVLMAEHSISLRDNTQAINHFKLALKQNPPNDSTIMIAMAKLYMGMNEMEQCQNICSQILDRTTADSNNPADHEAASVMLADISFRKRDFDNASYHFSQLLFSQPLYWTALARLIEVMRRSGTLLESISFLKRAEELITRPESEPGFNYCKGMYEWYTGNPNAALRFFNNARRDAEWGPQAVYNIVEICLNPDNDLPSEGTYESQEDSDLRDSKLMALNTAERLLMSELKPKTKSGILDDESLNHRILENFVLIASHIRQNVEKALQDFTHLTSQEEYKDNVGVIYGVACANVVLKQSHRAKNQLKRLNKHQWTFESAEYLERSWLLLADIYIQSSKYELAAELLAKTLRHNKSCAKAYELTGYIAEKEQAFKQAATNYEAAWKYSGKLKPNVGYKLAYSYMKAKNFADAIDTCQQILKNHPDYPSIKKDILDKCRNNLKT